MYQAFENFDYLLQCVEEDKVSTGINAASAGRFPVRFVMFNNFKDCYDFVDHLTDNGVELQSVDCWLDSQYPDLLITYSKLSDKICSFVRSKEDNDIVIAPFSELARFYNNNKPDIEFDTLISDIKAIQASHIAYRNHQRVYIPIVGLEAKMSKFYNDSQITVWDYKNPKPQRNYRLILTNGSTYGVNGLDNNYSVVSSVSEWLRLWRDQRMKRDIICTSRSIFAYAEYAQPDNAFDFVPCNSVHKFLTNGLGLHLSFLSSKEADKHWLELAKEINIESFDFKTFFNAKFDIHALAGFEVFVKTWFENELPFDRWLLTSYYQEKFCSKGYICESIKNLNGYTNSDLTQAIALTIFNLENPEDYLYERSAILSHIYKEKVVLSEIIQHKLIEKINQVVETSGYSIALQYVSLVTNAEKALLIDWVSHSYISKEDIRELYPQLYYYLGTSFGIKEAESKWVLKYIDAYKRAKVCNVYTDEVLNTICEKNHDTIKFNSWYHNFSTTRTVLNSRKDIDVFYWIDGLGLDWLPFIQYVIGLRKHDNFFLNEVYVSRADIPTKTENNKKSLLLLANDNLPKEGDLDTISHKVRQYPQYIIDDMEKIAEIINNILDNNPDKKIAIVSDHGISYLPQLCSGLNLPGFESDHGGRIASVKKPTIDNRYIILDDNTTVCALQHNSLCAKIHDGSGCHGGCTPEEVLVPILIISSQPNATNWTAKLQDFEVSASNPVLKFDIRGLSFNDIPIVEYNNVHYELIAQSGNSYITPCLPLLQDAKNIRLIIGDKYRDFKLELKLGLEEEDLF